MFKASSQGDENSLGIYGMMGIKKGKAREPLAAPKAMRQSKALPCITKDHPVPFLFVRLSEGVSNANPTNARRCNAIIRHSKSSDAIR